jgi:hypothetical protein
MPGVGSPCLALIAVLAAVPRPLPTQEKSLPQRIADVIVQLNGGIHTGFRFMHAKGVVLTDTFAPAPRRALDQYGCPPLTSGIQLSDDPMIALRSAVYALSVAHRR